MKKIIFYLALAIATIVLIDIINILVNDFNRLTEYGYGFLVGKIILVVVFIATAFFSRNNKQKSTN